MWRIPRSQAVASRENWDAIIASQGRPVSWLADNGAEMTYSAVLQWCQANEVEWHHIAPGRPRQNAFVVSLKGRLRDECLN